MTACDLGEKVHIICISVRQRSYGNVIFWVVSVCVFKGKGVPVQGLAPLDMFKLVQLGPYCTKSTEMPSCINLHLAMQKTHKTIIQKKKNLRLRNLTDLTEYVILKKLTTSLYNNKDHVDTAYVYLFT